ncbi:MAG: asparaginase domain-containing protein [Phycisphaerales bacterium]
MRHIELITTGGTIEKIYDEVEQKLVNRSSIVQRMLRRLRLADTEVHHRSLFHKDSLELTDRDRAMIVSAVRAAFTLSDGIVILHGTDTLHTTGELLHEKLFGGADGAGGEPGAVPVILAGAFRPFEMQHSDALQNLTEALVASSLVPPGVYCASHGRVLRFPGVVKDREHSRFVMSAGDGGGSVGA